MADSHSQPSFYVVYLGGSSDTGLSFRVIDRSGNPVSGYLCLAEARQTARRLNQPSWAPDVQCSIWHMPSVAAASTTKPNAGAGAPWRRSLPRRGAGIRNHRSHLPPAVQRPESTGENYFAWSV